MKSILSFFLVCFCLSASSQVLKKNALYFDSGIAAGNYFGLTFNLTFISKHNHSINLQLTGLLKKSPSEPEDYDQGIHAFITFGLNRGFDALNGIQLEYGKIFPLNKSGTIRFHPRAGLAYLEVITASNFQKIDDPGLGRNYNWDTNSEPTIALILQPKIELPFTYIFGYAIGPLFILSPKTQFYGITISTMLGRLRDPND